MWAGGGGPGAGTCGGDLDRRHGFVIGFGFGFDFDIGDSDSDSFVNGEGFGR
ncbi:hypothetical protein ACIQAD_23250 [Streptomyces sp. NPDC088551]|uniref:hypothetical protein n=1 Tax=Streptomyces sp. NPDC088551 TaxID=3365863 RepID=UPI0038260AB6